VRIGAHYLGNGRCEFTVWAPLVKKIELEVILPQPKIVPMEQNERGYWKAADDNLFPGIHYRYKIDGKKSRPDPASHLQPRGVHGPSLLVDHQQFTWEDENWNGIELSEMIIYELHVGTFTPAGTFAAIIPRLDALKKLGINAIELMPVAQFPGERNWGYDGVYPFAVQCSYGGPEGLKQLVNECHRREIAVVLDVVYNHLGPEGNYLGEFGPYFTEKYTTPWGRAINFDDAYSNEVRNFFIENALYWSEVYHVDALRIDAIHGIYDMSTRPFLQELAERVTENATARKRRVHLIAESDLNDTRAIRKRDQGGFGLNAQWCDDFHHALHTLLTGETQGYYQDFGKVEHLTTSLNEGYVYSGQYSPFRNRNHGNSSKDRPADQFVVFSQNHDQIGNRMFSERLSTLVSFESMKLAASTVILSPFIPLLFMGEEYGEESPFFYFVSHSDPDLVRAVREGRKREFQAFSWQGEPPDPQAPETFTRCVLRWEKRLEGKHKVLLDFYHTLIRLRKETPALSYLSKDTLSVSPSHQNRVIAVQRWHDNDQVLYLMNFNSRDSRFCTKLPEGTWKKILDSADEKWMGPGSIAPNTMATGQELLLQPSMIVLYRLEES